MKKIATLFFFFTLLLVLYPKQTTIPVFEENNEEIGFSYFDIYPKSITTQNFVSTFSGYQVLSLTPQINPLLETQIKNQTYSFTSDTLENNLYYFTKKYISNLQDHGFAKEASLVSIKGIPIQKVTLFTSYSEYQKLSHKLE